MIEKASLGMDRHVALRMHESIKRNGLRKEAGKIICKEENEIKEIKEEGVDQVNYEEVLRMDYLLRDGFLGYLSDILCFKKV
jgi:hypothetical protein